MGREIPLRDKEPSDRPTGRRRRDAGEFRYLNAAQIYPFGEMVLGPPGVSISPLFVLICFEFKWTQSRGVPGWEDLLRRGSRRGKREGPPGKWN